MSSVPPPADFNPFEAPRTRIGAGPAGLGAGGEDEAIRRRYLGHEASVKSIGSLYYLGAILVGLAMGAAIWGVASEGGNDGGAVFAAAALAVAFALTSAMGYGLSNLKNWARWIAVVLMGLGMLNNLANMGIALAMGPDSVPGYVFGVSAIGLLIAGYILYLLVSPAGSMVFSPAYKGVMARTPHIRYKTSIVLKIFLGLIVFVLLLAVVGAVLRRGR